ncbi:hypothetical protein HAX54_034255 [Datura stramonium]|uniref:Uncharacterized protein n=1 Tax=Datura stramonium TaxID=4076 RepID=A0ABS8SE00_DATST|nr:hypothetical protein [Datura stramonium]
MLELGLPWSRALRLPTSRQRSKGCVLLLQKMLSALFALLSIKSRMRMILPICDILSMQHVLTYGFSSTPHAQFVEFLCAKHLKKRKLCNRCLVQLSDHYVMDSLNVSSNHCISAEQMHSPRLHDSLRTDSTTDTQCPPEGGMMVVTGNDVILNEDSHNTKNTENKQVESPSTA